MTLENICLRKSKITVVRISLCIGIEKLMEHGIHCVPCFYTNDVIDLFHSSNDVILFSV